VKRPPSQKDVPPDLLSLHEQLQLAIRTGGSTLGQILEAVPVGIFVIDAAGKPFYANRIAQRLLGKGIAPDAGPNQLAETYHAYLAGTSTPYPAPQMPIVRALSGEAAVVTDMEIHHPDRVIPLQVWSAPIVDEQGTVIFAIAAFSDISERKDAERRLSSQYEVARALAESPSFAEAAPRILRAVGEIAQWDYAALWKVDSSAGVLRCVDLWQRQDRRDDEFAQATRSKSYRPNEGLPGVVWNKGSYEWIVDAASVTNDPARMQSLGSGFQSAAAFPIMFGSRVLGVMEFMSRERRLSDARLVEMMEAHGSQMGQFIERELAERRLREAKEDAEHEARSKADFLAIMSHEIRTPMNAVTGMTGLLLETELGREQREYAQMAQVSAESLLSVINDILDFSRIESGNLVLESHPFELNACIEEVFDLVAHQALVKRLDLVSMTEPGVPDFIQGDSTRLRQVIVNLVNNAIKFTESGHIVVSVRPVGAVVDGNVTLEFTVEDTGSGISSDKLSQLFKPFTQADSSTTRRHGGTGLGLAICKKLVDLMGGSISVQSSLGKGSRFTFTVVAATAAGVKKRHTETAVPELSGKTALIISDVTVTLGALAEYLRGWGMNHILASSVEDARKAMELRTHFDLIILDTHDGESRLVALTANLRNAYGAKAPPIVLLSFLGTQEGIEERLPGHVVFVISKPVKKTQLFDAVTDAVSGKGSGWSLEVHRRLDPHLSEKLPLRILVAEDNEMNQKLMLLVLQQMGYQADVAGNGREVLTDLERQHYDLIFMDVEMPEMDGLEATQTIVHRWPEENRPVIVGTTAYGLAGEEHQCLVAGMNDCINKPIRIEQIQDCILRWGGGRIHRLPSDGAPPVASAGVLDSARIGELEEMGNRAKKDVIRELATVYLEDLPGMFKALCDALEGGDTAYAARAAHRLKGTSLNVGANGLADICRVIEAQARQGRNAGFAELLRDLQARTTEAEQALKDLLTRRVSS
jgi:signal transduction histidine kinase/DNA-binding response OmpR family regulator/HPt (histidine-containing phosphotransfer) domain-containing protein